MVSGDDQFPTLVISVPFASRSVIVICLSASFHSNVPVSLNAPPPSICPSVRTSSRLEEPRREYLDQACRDDRDLRARVEALLRVHDEDRSFLQRPAEGVSASPEPLIRI